jgi:uncharacterized protein YjbI with pentapeptide repeats
VNLGRANLSDALINGAHLRGADLSGATLSGADLFGADLTDASWPKGTPVPEGWKLDTSSGRLNLAGTGPESAAAN